MSVGVFPCVCSLQKYGGIPVGQSPRKMSSVIHSNSSTFAESKIFASKHMWILLYMIFPHTRSHTHDQISSNSNQFSGCSGSSSHLYNYKLQMCSWMCAEVTTPNRHFIFVVTFCHFNKSMYILIVAYDIASN